MNMQSNTSPDTNPNTTYTVTLEEEDDNLLLPIPEEMMVQLGWNEGDLLEWIIQDDHIKLIKVEDDGTI